MMDAQRDPVTDAAIDAKFDQCGWALAATYASLPDAFWVRAEPTQFPAPKLVGWNANLANELGLSTHAINDDALAHFATGQRLPRGATPIAQAYAGHQYGHGTMLGDGRAILVGEQRTPTGKLIDIQYKGAGETHFSRRGDGRAALGPMLREYIVGEAMHALGIPSTRALAVATTGEMISRDGLKRGAVLVRTAASHLRVGTFEYAAALGEVPLLESLTRYAIQRHDPDLQGTPDSVVCFLRRIVARHARLVAQWQSVGFVHGVLNTDNVAISGETLDYGPCAFIDSYDPDTVFSSIDRHGRYRYSQQPSVTQWNLARLAESLLPLLEKDSARAIDLANAALAEFPAEYERAWLARFRAKLGLAVEHDDDAQLVRDLFAWMHAARADFTLTFRTLAEQLNAGEVPDCAPFTHDDAFAAWATRWRARISLEVDPWAVPRRMRAENPSVIARNHRVEEAIAAAEERDDLAPFERLLEAVRNPFLPDSHHAALREPPPIGGCAYRTFCGT